MAPHQIQLQLFYLLPVDTGIAEFSKACVDAVDSPFLPGHSFHQRLSLFHPRPGGRMKFDRGVVEDYIGNLLDGKIITSDPDAARHK